MIVPVVKRYPQAMDGTDVRGYPVVIALTHAPARVQAGQWRITAMNTSRRILLTGLAGLAVAPTAVVAAPAPVANDATVAEERFARMIAAAHAPDVTCARQAARYADAHWPDYVVAARAVLEARV
ncbi:hypothetical protein NLM23_36640 [Bradyrhizobium cajani]|nr:hypothetical protein [Bradyrhizobium cajani]MCP3374573.1 hypothetical protein [Bradyrhizobium cajani]